jgi:hypothetical protein
MMMRRRGPGLVRAAATTAVIAGTAGAVRHRQEQKYANQAQEQAMADQQAMAEQQAMMQQAAAQAVAAQQAAAPAAAPGGDLMAQLQQLAQLKDAGVLSEQEFAAAKAKLLG